MGENIDLSNNDVIHVKKGDIEYLQFRKLLEYDNIITHAYSLGTDLNFRTASKNNISEKDTKKAINDYKVLCNSVGLDYINIIKPNQAHSNNVKKVESKINKDEPDINLENYFNTDGLITNKREMILSTTNADCILLLIFDPVKKIIANVHSGWRGTLQRIVVTTLKKLINEYGCNPKDIICCICPSIRKCHFEVDKKEMILFEKEFKEWLDTDFIQEKEKNKDKDKNQKWNIDTVILNKLMMKKEGIKPENIIDSGLCSVCNSNLIHSYRVEKEGYGLATALIALK